MYQKLHAGIDWQMDRNESCFIYSTEQLSALLTPPTHPPCIKQIYSKCTNKKLAQIENGPVTPKATAGIMIVMFY